MSIIVKPEALEKEAAEAAEIRHQLHSHPEIGLELTNTETLIVSALKRFGADEIVTRVGGEHVTGTVAVVHGNRPGRTIGLRADGDALPVIEKTGAPYASETAGRMHACGHDGHTATLLAAVHYFAEHRDFAGTVVAIFQPGEEGFAGGRYMLEDGLLERFGIDEFYALHAGPGVPVGSVSFDSGYATANADVFKITFEGKGGHGSRPHLALDPVVAAADCVMALQTIASRNAMPDKTAIVSVGSLQAGNPSGSSVIPQTATLIGTTRCYEPDVRDLIERRMKEITEGIAATYGMKGICEYTRLYPAMYDDPKLVDLAKGYLSESLGAEKVLPSEKTPIGEDFAFMLLKKPGCLFWLGMQDETHNAALHSDTFNFNDKAIATGASALVTIALNRMAA